MALQEIRSVCWYAVYFRAPGDQTEYQLMFKVSAQCSENPVPMVTQEYIQGIMRQLEANRYFDVHMAFEVALDGDFCTAQDGL